MQHHFTAKGDFVSVCLNGKKNLEAELLWCTCIVCVIGLLSA